MSDSSAFHPETLAKIAAQLNPKLAYDDPAKAIQLARDLLTAADPELAKQAAEQDEETELHKESQRRDELFPRGERISVAEAFKRLPGHYKTEGAFTNALRKENLTTTEQDVNLPKWQKSWPSDQDKFVQYREVTSLKAVDELFRRQREKKNAIDRARKKAFTERQRTSPNKKSKKLQRNSDRKNGNSTAEKRKPRLKKRTR